MSAVSPFADMRPVLVAYGSRYGSTAEIAEQIGAVLQEHGLPVLVTRAGQAGDLSQYRAAVIGSGIYAGRWERDAARLLKRGRKALEAMPLWIFSSGPVGEWPEPEVLPPGAERKARRAGARDHALFGGRVPSDSSSWIVRRMAQRTDPEHADLRDWQRIRDWAAGVAQEIDSDASAVEAPAA